MEFHPEDISDPIMAPGRYACLTVSDTGKGIKPKHIERIFDSNFTAKGEGKGTEKVIIADDELDILKMEKKMLERLGYRVTVKNSSKEAFETFRRDPKQFDVIIFDMTMLEMAGDTLARRLLEVRPDIPIIICSGFNSRMNEEKAKKIGIRGFIMKPVIKREVAKAIRQAVDTEVA